MHPSIVYGYWPRLLENIMTENAPFTTVANHLNTLLDSTRSPLRVNLAWGPGPKLGEGAELDNLYLVTPMSTFKTLETLDSPETSRWALSLHYQRYASTGAGRLRLDVHNRRDSETMNGLAANLFDDEIIYEHTPPKCTLARTASGQSLRMADLRVVQLLTLALGAAGERQHRESDTLLSVNLDHLTTRLEAVISEQLAVWRQIGVAI